MAELVGNFDVYWRGRCQTCQRCRPVHHFFDQRTFRPERHFIIVPAISGRPAHFVGLLERIEDPRGASNQGEPVELEALFSNKEVEFILMPSSRLLSSHSGPNKDVRAYRVFDIPLDRG